MCSEACWLASLSKTLSSLVVTVLNMRILSYLIQWCSSRPAHRLDGCAGLGWAGAGSNPGPDEWLSTGLLPLLVLPSNFWTHGPDDLAPRARPWSPLI